MKVAIYGRVSTDDKEQNPERQKISCEKYADIHKHEIIGFECDYISGDTNPLDRIGFNKVLKLNPDGILFDEISRFSREHPIKVMRRLQDLKNKGIKIISISEQLFNMEGEFSDLLQYIMTWFNSYYLRNLKRNVKAGLERARKQGKNLGRPSKKINKWEIIRLRKAGKSLREISKETSTSLAGVQRCIKKVTAENPNLFINKT